MGNSFDFNNNDCLRGGENSFDGSVISDKTYECKKCDLETTSRFDYFHHMENVHGQQWGQSVR